MLSSICTPWVTAVGPWPLHTKNSGFGRSQKCFTKSTEFSHSRHFSLSIWRNAFMCPNISKNAFDRIMWICEGWEGPQQWQATDEPGPLLPWKNRPSDQAYRHRGCCLHCSALSGTTKVRNSGLGPDPDLSAKSGPELVTRSGFFLDAPGMTW